MQSIITQQVQELHGKVKIVPIKVLEVLENDIHSVRDGEYKSDLIDLIAKDFFSFKLPNLQFTVRSIIVTAMPKPYVLAKFKWKGKCYSFPNEDYLPHIDNSKKVGSILNAILNPKGYHVKEVKSLPMKPLAVRSGLSLYGRNNVTYVEGMGSFINLKAFYSDVSCDSHELFKLRRMGACERCSQCLASCPTGAIKVDRHIIKAEQCLTYLNEFIDAEGFPDWLSASAHNSLHGCIVCQVACPMNKPYINNIESSVEFDEDETQLILDGIRLEDLPQAMMEKVHLLCLENYLPLLPRNLSVLLAK